MGKGQVIDLAGKWEVRLDTSNSLVKNHVPRSYLSGFIQLPGSLAERGFGVKSEGSDYGILTPEYKYIGKAWYSRKITIPAEWRTKDVVIFLERVLWESRVYIDGMELSCQDALGTPHYHHVGQLDPGEYKLTILVNNEMIHNIGDKGHAYGSYTQSIWNGIIGRIEMNSYDPFRITSTQVFSSLEKDELHLKIDHSAQKNTSANVSYEIFPLYSDLAVLTNAKKYGIKAGKPLIIKVQNQGKLKKWSEFTPQVYILKLRMETGDYTAHYETEFGYCQISKSRSKILVNDSPVFLRGNLDCVHFPLTGYPSCNVDDWVRIFETYKEYGLNHARFHSWCPPEAAFRAANRVGIYLQVEASIWIDWWMSTDMIARGRPEMDTQGHPKGLGYDPDRDQFVISEMNRVVQEYANHPSFTMFCIGNELGNSDFEVMKTWVSELKQKDPRKLYAVSTARTITEVDDYNATHYIKGLGSTRGLRGTHTNWDFDTVYSKMNIPIIAHEIGQWPVYPQWSEIAKYQGVLKARNLEGFMEVSKRNGIGHQDVEFAKASGALNQIMYKYETESFLRTASCAGVQLLSMQDYQGQGEALIGWLDAFWDSKEITTPIKFRRHFNTVVPLLRMDKFIWKGNEEFTARVQLAQYGASAITASCEWEIAGTNKVYASGQFDERTFAMGTLTDIGEIKFNLSEVQKSEKLTVRVGLPGFPYENQWDIWIYPDISGTDQKSEILISEELNDQTKKVLDEGGKVLLLAHELGTEETSVLAHFYPLYWSLTFFPGQGKTCIGLLVQNNHPAFDDFPTSFHSDWQWESISGEAKGFILNDLPPSYQPIAQPIDDFHRNNKLGSIFEFAVGNGKMLVCGYNLKADLPVAQQLKHSLLNYMDSKEFAPIQQIKYASLTQMLPAIPKVEISDLPPEFKESILYVEAAGNVESPIANLQWDKSLDNVIIAKQAAYQLKADGVYRDAMGAAWHGKNLELEIECPEGILGSLFIHFDDWNNQQRTGLLEFEGRKHKLAHHSGSGQWVKFLVMREDSNDGKIVIKAKSLTGSNLMISKVALIPDR